MNLVLESFIRRIREKLLDFDFDGLSHLDEAPDALPHSRTVDLQRHEDPIVQGLQSRLDVEFGSGLHSDDGIAEIIGDRHVERPFTHLAGAVHEVVDVDRERILQVVSHRNTVLGDSPCFDAVIRGGPSLIPPLGGDYASTAVNASS